LETNTDADAQSHARFAGRRAKLVLEVIGDKWTVAALYELVTGAKRFGQLRASLKGISQKMLTQTLRKLEEFALISRTVYPTKPPAVEYALTAAGRSLVELLGSVAEWVDEYMRLTAAQMPPDGDAKM
jgi:DNA-binding HxlR family transcriptional regulator